MSAPDTEVTRQILPAIRVFAEAARQRSFSRAGQMLGLSQGGVSRQVAALERHLGVALFERRGSTVALTDAGRQYFEAVGEPLAAVEFSTRQLRRRAAAPGRLIVRSSLPSLATTVLVPALARCPPDLPVDIVTSLSPPAPLDAFDVLVTRDLALPGADHWMLLDETLVCVASPALCARQQGRPLAQWPVLAVMSRPELLALWASLQEVPTQSLQVAARLDHYFLALSAAIAGLGCLVVPHVLAASAIGQGLLVDVGWPPVRSGAYYSAYINPRCAMPQAAAAFCRWLRTDLQSLSKA
jgi:LysR family glycine cleavage system transcriptional activator